MTQATINQMEAGSLALQCRLHGFDHASARAYIAAVEYNQPRFGRLHVPTIKRLAYAAVADIDAKNAASAARKQAWADDTARWAALDSDKHEAILAAVSLANVAATKSARQKRNRAACDLARSYGFTVRANGIDSLRELVRA
jgi:hypothetical protein